jgi:PST family polysaccharide transporter
VFQNTAAQLAGRGLGLILSAATSVLLARYLGRERLGEYGAIYAYLALYGFLASFSLEQILAREVSIRKQQAAELFYTGTLTVLGFSVFGAILAPTVAPLFGYTGQLRWLIGIAAVDTLILPPFGFSGIIFQVEMKMWYGVVIGLLRQALWLAAIVLLALGNAAFYWVIIARTLCGFATVAAVLWAVRRSRLVQGTWHFLAQDARSMLRAGFPLVLTMLSVGIYHRIDQVMLHKMSGDRALGPYVIAVQLIELFSVLPVALMGSLFPALSQSAGEPERFLRYLRESYRFLLVIVFAACAVITPVAAPAIQLFYGKEFLATASLLIVLIWSEVPIFFSAVLGSALIAKGLQRHVPIPAMLGAVVNVLLNLWAIPRYGALGASWATVISYSIGTFYILLIPEVRPLVALGLRIAVWPFLLSLGITFLLMFLPIAFWWKLPIAALSYLAGAWFSGMIERNDIDRIRLIFRKAFSYGT